jgi:hypothetical protein
MAGLNFSSIPALTVPLRFYFTAVLFALAGALLFLQQGELIWLSRWMPGSLALTHLIALGVMAHVMIGSLFQVMPVLCGAPIVMGRGPMIMMQLALAAGTLSLSGAFLGRGSFSAGLLLLALSLGYFAFSLLRALLLDARGEQTRIPILLAVLALALLILAGTGQLAGYLWGWQLTAGKSLTHLHAGMGLFGWVLLLVMAVSFQVIPMFHVTPAYSRFWRHGLVGTTAGALLLMLLFTLSGYPVHYLVLLLALCGVLYALVSLERLSKRKRKLPDVVIRYWQVGLVCLSMVCIAIALVDYLPLSDNWRTRIEILIGLLAGLGFVLGIIQGMLLKIVPFLINLHLQSLAMKYPAAMMLLPDHYSLISRRQGRIQFYLYCLLLGCVVLAALMPPASLSIGLALLLNWLVIGYNLATACLTYRRVRREMLATGAGN